MIILSAYIMIIRFWKERARSAAQKATETPEQKQERVKSARSKRSASRVVETHEQRHESLQANRTRFVARRAVDS